MGRIKKREVKQMTEKEEFDINEYITDEQIKKFGHTRETFQESNLKLLLESMLYGAEKTIQEETQRLMKEHSLTYGEARSIATKQVIKSISKGK